MAPQNSQEPEPKTVQQPLTPEEVTPEQREEQRATLRQGDPTVNPGDRVEAEKSLGEKARQVAVDTADITGDRITVPTYFVTDEPNGEHRALHHVKDAEEISDVIRQARITEDGERTWR